MDEKLENLISYRIVLAQGEETIQSIQKRDCDRDVLDYRYINPRLQSKEYNLDSNGAFVETNANRSQKRRKKEKRSAQSIRICPMSPFPYSQ
jgi:hypothetical protein